ncbi:hypothetical protein SO802_002162 [Lithocarpus litseifolius]|uniref:MCAfunc domain-containing protein n=1 Tax=Lithocarpus litseifolius TaxID=425828 RepID=A0AAW2DWR5_9ROSI
MVTLPLSPTCTVSSRLDTELALLPFKPMAMKERLEDIERDQREYTLDEEDRKVQTVILKPSPSQHDAMVLKKTLSCSYPNLPFNEALQKENEKLHLELQHSQANLDVSQCEVIQHLLEVTEVAAIVPEKRSPEKAHKKVERNYSDASDDKGNSSDEGYHKRSDNRTTSRFYTLWNSGVTISNIMFSSQNRLPKNILFMLYDAIYICAKTHLLFHPDMICCQLEAHTDMKNGILIYSVVVQNLACVDLNCIKTFFFTCGTLSKIATVANNRHICCKKFSLCKQRLLSGSEQAKSPKIRPLLHWGSPDLEKLLNILSNIGINGSVEQCMCNGESEKACIVHIHEPKKALIEIGTSTIISVGDENLASKIFEDIDKVLEGI